MRYPGVAKGLYVATVSGLSTYWIVFIGYIYNFYLVAGPQI